MEQLIMWIIALTYNMLRTMSFGAIVLFEIFK